MFEVVICDPDEIQFESTNLGLLYTAVSRATTLGDDDGRNSAIYFFTKRGDSSDSCKDFDGGRIRNIGKCKQGGQDYTRLNNRKQWVKHLSNNTRETHLSPTDQDRVLEWSKSNRVCYGELYNRISLYTLHKTQNRWFKSTNTETQPETTQPAKKRTTGRKTRNPKKRRT